MGESGKEFEFVGVAHALPESVRKWQIDDCDVLYDPRTNRPKGDFDIAHANLIFRTKPPEAILSAIDDLLLQIEFTPAHKIREMPRARCGPPWPYRILSWIFLFC